MFRWIYTLAIVFLQWGSSVYGFGEIDYDLNQFVLRAAAQKDNSATNYVAVGRTWVPADAQYKGILVSYVKASGAQDVNFNRTGSTPSRLTFDFAGAGADNLCNAVVYAFDGFIAACRSKESNGYYEIYLVKVNNSGTLDATFGTAGIKKTGLAGNSTDGHAFVRGIIYDSATGNGGNNGTVVIAGAIGKYSPGVFHPFIAAFDQKTGAQYGTTTTLSGIDGTAVAIAFDSANSKYYTASTDTLANHDFYVHQFNTSLTAAGAPWGNPVDFTAAISGGAADSVPSGIAVVGTNVITVGANRATTSDAWRCAVTAHVTTTGNLNTGFGTVNSPLTGGTANTGITLLTVNTARDCILNSVSTPPSGSTLNAVGTVYNGSNYDFLATQMNNSGTLTGGFGSSGIQSQSGGSADDVLNFGLYLSGATSSYYGVGRAQNSSLVSGAVSSKIATAGGSFNTSTSNVWAATTTNNAPAVRVTFTSQWTGSNLIIWGSASLNTGGRYDPVADSWATMATLSAPAAKSEACSAWTGSKFVVWSGTYANNTGGVYDPSANTWTVMATLNAPGGRRNTNSEFPWTTWTGTYVVFWGGRTSAFASTNTGGLYNVATDTWTTMATLSAPTVKDNFESTWTGSKYFVFGGFDIAGGANSNTSGSYDPSTNVWTAGATLGAPSPRYAVASAWTGSSFYIWGGTNNYGGTGYVNDGAYYTPSSNTWTSITTLSAPGPRQGVRGVWTGSKFIVWSGYNGSFLNTGGIYDASTGTWGTMTTLNAPAIRHYSHVFWTGNKMIIWGMQSSSVNTGGMYTP